MKLKLVKKIEEARGTKSFFFEPDKNVNWLPGQYYYYTLPELKFDDSRGPTRHFTISSSPTEGNLLRLTTRIRQESGYKKTLEDLKIGAIIEGEGPEGTFILDEEENNKKHIFLAGGIGITPFRTFIKYNLDKELNIPMYLIYSNGDPDYVFGKELKEWSNKSDLIKIEFFDTSKSGHLDGKSLRSLFTEHGLLSEPTFWISGPPAFVRAMEAELDKLKISSVQIRTDKFTGY